MNIPKYHHHFPKFLLRNWADQDGKIFVQQPSKRHEISATSIDKVLGRNHANSYLRLDGSRNPQAENELAKFESELAAISKKLLKFQNQHTNEIFDPIFTESIHALFWNILLRSPILRQKHEVTDTFYKENILQEVRNNDQFVRFLERATGKNLEHPDLAERIKSYIHVNAFSSLWSKPPQELSRFGILVLYPLSTRKSFVVGENAIAMSSLQNSDHQLAVLPVAPRAAIAPTPYAGFITKRALLDADVRSINLQLANQNKQVVSTSKELLTSLTFAR